MEVMGTELRGIWEMQRQVVGGLFAVGLAVAGSAAAMPSSNASETDQVATTVERSVGFAHVVSDEAAMVLLGTALIGLAGAVKRAA
jgi:hypothetical protein